ncbi:RNA-guided pseudouridylation complex pseudouridine synthase subunit Cbf5, partial [Candidatus Micrarchaeota archaeon]|nr:RNA-guided pseudouridylation complex pseudouridine synthase subunit Cbf5 [Candidatus Micrarchaeota archaeon]
MAMLVLQKEEAVLGRKIEERPLEERLRYGLIIVDKPPGPTSHEVS